MGFVSQYCITNIIIVRNLNIVKKDNILKLCRVSNYAALSHHRFAADKCAVAHFCVLTNDSWSVNTCGWCNFGGFCDPDVTLQMIILFRIQCFSQFYNEISNLWKNFPWISFPRKKLSCNCLAHIQHIGDGKIF